jgi:hypothetical protein
LRPPRFAVLRFAVVLRFDVLRFAVVFRRAVLRFAVVLRPPLLLVLARRRVVFRPPPLLLADDALIGEGGGGVGLEGSGVGQTDPGSFCADQSVPWSSCMVPPQIDGTGRARLGISNSVLHIKRRNSASTSSVWADVEIVEQEGPASEWRPWEPPFWIIALGLTLALLVGFAVAGQVQDPRLANVLVNPPAPTKCVERTPAPNAPNHVWIYCPD